MDKKEWFKVTVKGNGVAVTRFVPDFVVGDVLRSIMPYKDKMPKSPEQG